MSITAPKPVVTDKTKLSRPKPYMRFVLDPFQIFCLANRTTVTQNNPGKKNSEITSLLAQMWRSLPEKEKQKYQYLATKLQHNKCKIQRRSKSPSRKKEATSHATTGEGTSDTAKANPEIKMDEHSEFPGFDSEENLMALLGNFNLSILQDD